MNPGSGPRGGYAAMTKLAIYKYHATASADAARQHLQRLLDRFGSTSKKLSAEGELDAYITWAEHNGLIVADRKVRLAYDLGSGCYSAARYRAWMWTSPAAATGRFFSAQPIRIGATSCARHYSSARWLALRPPRIGSVRRRTGPRRDRFGDGVLWNRRYRRRGSGGARAGDPPRSGMGAPDVTSEWRRSVRKARR